MNLFTRLRELAADFDEKQHPRGQPKNKGEFVKKGSPKATKATPTAVPIKPAVKSNDWQHNQELHSAVSNTVGATIVKGGIKMHVTRWQNPDQSNKKSLRTGVFFLPEKDSPVVQHFGEGGGSYGGPHRFDGTTVVNSPMVVKAPMGGHAAQRAYDALMGKGAYDKIWAEFDKTVPQLKTYSKPDDVKAITKATTTILKKYGGKYEMADYIVKSSRDEEDFLGHAVLENIAACAVRKAGYDSVLAYNNVKGKPRLVELFDLRADRYPKTSWEKNDDTRTKTADRAEGPGYKPKRKPKKGRGLLNLARSGS